MTTQDATFATTHKAAWDRLSQDDADSKSARDEINNTLTELVREGYRLLAAVRATALPAAILEHHAMIDAALAAQRSGYMAASLVQLAKHASALAEYNQSIVAAIAAYDAAQ